MTAQEVGLYTMLLCRMYEESGPIEDHPLRLATYCGMRQLTFEKTLQKLVDLGKIDRENGTLFNDRARKEISSRANDLKVAIKAGKASAEKRQQKQQKSSTPVQRPFNHTDTDTDTVREEPKGSLSACADTIHSSPLSEAVQAYNIAADHAGWPKVAKITPARSKSLRARLKECGGMEGWRDALRKAYASDFCREDWKGFNLDSLVSQKNFTNLMEGRYDNRNRKAKSPQGRENRADPALEQIARLAGLGQASGHGGR